MTACRAGRDAQGATAAPHAQASHKGSRADVVLIGARGMRCFAWWGTVIAAPSAAQHINPIGNAALATAGTSDVLAGLVGAALASPGDASSATLQNRVAAAVFQHG